MPKLDMLRMGVGMKKETELGLQDCGGAARKSLDYSNKGSVA